MSDIDFSKLSIEEKRKGVYVKKQDGEPTPHVPKTPEDMLPVYQKDEIKRINSSKIPEDLLRNFDFINITGYTYNGIALFDLSRVRTPNVDRLIKSVNERMDLYGL